VEEEQRRAQIRIHKRREEKRERKTSDPNPSLPTSSKPRRCNHLQMYGGHESERERAGRKGVTPLTKAATVALSSGGMEDVWVAAGREREKEGGAARRWRDRKCDAWCERWKWQRVVKKEWG